MSILQVFDHSINNWNDTHFLIQSQKTIIKKLDLNVNIHPAKELSVNSKRNPGMGDYLHETHIFQ
jgi:hypothetical protein